jgi:hypothetical protein
MAERITPELRALGMWQALFSTRAEGEEPPGAPDRSIVTKADAKDALLFAAAAIDEVLQAGLPEHLQRRALHALHMLLVARDYVDPLPSPPGSEDLLRDDLEAGVSGLRSARS